MTELKNGWEVLVTGTVISEPGQPKVVDLLAIVATTYTKNHPDFEYFKVWPVNSQDPKLPNNHDNKLWFSRSEAEIQVINKWDD